jgi:hypothetical protein
LFAVPPRSVEENGFWGYRFFFKGGKNENQ